MTARTRLSEIYRQMTLPVIAAPMFLVSGPDLVLASCRGGVIGSFPFPNSRSIELLDEWLGRINAELAADRAAGRIVAPWAANMVTHRSYDRLDAELELVARHQPPIVITALGGPGPVIPTVHSYGGLVFADVNSVPYAKKAAEAGADGLVLVSSGAGGHTGQMSPFAFVTAVREFFNGIIVLAGSVATGQAVRASEMLGADFAYVGTPFIASSESLANDEYRQMLIDASFEDLVLSNKLTGAYAYYLKASLEKMGLDPANPGAGSAINFGGAQTQIKAWKDVWSAGHGVGSVRDIAPAAALIARLKAEYDRADASHPFLDAKGSRTCAPQSAM
ncbi:NAD(P)H-dependent flavin oxidoreductase [Govanella unica]|uniref:Nitronate monooxygenase n=1 Tax=Govanella unica TaxID=2975056 RepID=A0A9X3TZD6_9PROT|nr:nitronate monooxygenase [Govania unica]MDA5194766.1 nitronate monooxygenase [Govania unica]